MASSGQTPEVSEKELLETRNLILEGISYQLEDDRRMSEDKFKKTVKQLLLKWHPDKNADMVELATSATQHIHSEVERLEQGLPRGFTPGQAPAPGEFHPGNIFAGSDTFRKYFEEAYRANRERSERERPSYDFRNRYTSPFSSRPTTGPSSTHGTYTPPNPSASSHYASYAREPAESTTKDYKPFTKPRENIPKSRSNPNFGNGTSNYKPSTHDFRPPSSRFGARFGTEYDSKNPSSFTNDRSNVYHEDTKSSTMFNQSDTTSSGQSAQRSNGQAENGHPTSSRTDPSHPESASGQDEQPTGSQPSSDPSQATESPAEGGQPSSHPAEDEVPSDGQPSSHPAEDEIPSDGQPSSHPAEDEVPSNGQPSSSRSEESQPPWSSIGLAEKPLLLIRQAHHDLRAADNDYKAEEPAYDWVCFKTHQASEKALKALYLIKSSTKSFNHELTSLAAMTGEEELKRLATRLQAIIGETNKLYNLVQVDVDVIPHDEFTKDMACDAIMYANDILQRVTEIVGML